MWEPDRNYTLEEMERIFALEEKKERFRRDIEGFEAHIREFRTAINLADIEIIKIKTPQGWKTFEDVMNANWYHVTAIMGHQAAKKLIEDWIDLHPGIADFMGIHNETAQVVFSIRLDQNIPLESQLGILDVYPFIRPNKDGMRLIDIVEHTLSQYCSYVLECRSENEFVLVANRIDRETFSTLREAVEYIYVNHPYRRKKVKRKEYDEDEDGY